MKSDFLAHLSHEIRTPLTSLLMGLHLLDRSRASPQDPGPWIDVCLEEGERLRRLIEQLLSATRMNLHSAENERAHWVPHPPESLLQAALGTVAAEAHIRGVLFNLDLAHVPALDVASGEPPAQIDFVCDPCRLGWVFEQVLFHLIRSASRGYVIHVAWANSGSPSESMMDLIFSLDGQTENSGHQTLVTSSPTYQISDYGSGDGRAGLALAVEVLEAMELPHIWFRPSFSALVAAPSIPLNAEPILKTKDRGAIREKFVIRLHYSRREKCDSPSVATVHLGENTTCPKF